jgi:predicted MPP superfamily phosphohydrolase
MSGTTGLIIFLTIVLGVYFGGNFYIYKRALQALSLVGISIFLLKISLLALILAFPIGRLMDRFCRCEASNYMTLIGSFWLGAMLYIFLTLVFIDLLRVVNHYFNVFPQFINYNTVTTGRILFVCVFALVSATLVLGYHSARNAKITQIDVPLEKLSPEHNAFNIVQISDVHLGTIIHKKRLIEIVDKANALDPDLVLITGDLVDESVDKLEDMVEPLSRIKSRLGVYAVTGNHEFYAGVDKAVRFMEQAGVRVLRNRYVTIDSTLNLVGLDYITPEGWRGKEDLLLEAIMKDMDKSLPTILMYHAPVKLKKVEAVGIDLQLSGHTHKGQLFPLNFITDLVYMVDSGYARIGKMQIYVSNGVGTWGPPIRVGAPPEIVQIKLKSINDSP